MPGHARETVTKSPPTEKQLETLRRIAYASKGTFAWPQTKAQASAEIKRMMTSRQRRKGRARLT